MLTIGKVFSEGVRRSIGHLEGVEPYADDIYIFGPTLELYLERLENTLKCLREDGYVVSATKCALFKRELNVLGHIVGGGEMRIEPSRIQAI